MEPSKTAHLQSFWFGFGKGIYLFRDGLLSELLSVKPQLAVFRNMFLSLA